MKKTIILVALTLIVSGVMYGQLPVTDNLVLWLDASQLNLDNDLDNEDPVATWEDQSGEGNDATQLTPANQPTYIEDGLNGKPAISFNGINQWLDVANFVDALDQPFYFSIIWKIHPDADNSRHFAIDGLTSSDRLVVLANENDITGVDTNNNIAIWAGGSSVGYVRPTPFDDTPHGWLMTSAIFDGDDSELFEDGIFKADGNPGGNPLNGFTIGSRFDNSEFLHGYISEIIVYDRALSDAEIYLVDKHLADKYDIDTDLREFLVDSEEEDTWQPSFPGARLDLNFTNVTQSGDITPIFHSTPPPSPTFNGVEPANVSTYYWAIESDVEVDEDDGGIKVQFDINGLPGVDLTELKDDEQDLSDGIVIFRRSDENDDFVALDTNYSNGILSANVDSFSEFVLGSNDPSQTLPVELSSFTAIVTANMFVQIEWTAETETNMLGYNIYRSENDNFADSERVNFTIIAAYNSSGAVQYSYLDTEVTPGNNYYYWLESRDLDLTNEFHGPISVLLNEEGETAPLQPELVTSLKGAYPNPFNPGTTISFSLAEESNVSIDVFNTKGQLVRNLVSNQSFGRSAEHSVYWDGLDNSGNSVSSGIYLYIMETDNEYQEIKKMIMMK